MKERSVKSEYELVKEILKRNPEYLDKYIKENLSHTQLRKIMKSKDSINDEKSKSSQESASTPVNINRTCKYYFATMFNFCSWNMTALLNCKLVPTVIWHINRA